MQSTKFVEICSNFLRELGSLTYTEALVRWTNIVECSFDVEVENDDVVPVLIEKVESAFEERFSFDGDFLDVEFETYTEEYDACPCCYGINFLDGYCLDCEEFFSGI